MPRNIQIVDIDSKKISGTSLQELTPEVTLHGRPVSRQSLGDKIAVLSPPPPVNQPSTAVVAALPTILSTNGSGLSSSTTENQETEDPYFYLTNLSKEKPVIVMQADFYPVYNAGNYTQEGSFLNIKCSSKTLTAATAVCVLSQSIGASSFIQQNKTDLTEFLSQYESLDIDRKIVDLESVEGTLYPSQHLTNDIAMFPKILNDFGHDQSDIKKYSETKLWLQSIFELKKSLLTYTNAISSFDSKRTGDPVDKTPDTISKLNIALPVLNPYPPSVPSLIGNEIVQDTYYFNCEAAYKDYDSKVYSYISKFEELRREDFSFSFRLRPDNVEDDLIAASSIFKENLYSCNLGKTDGSFPYPVSESEGGNISLWDRIVGLVPSKITSIVQKLPPQKDMTSYCQSVSNDGSIKVNTFENLSLANNVSIPSAYASYFESSLDSLVENPTSQTNTSKIDDFITLTADKENVCNNVLRLLQPVEDSSHLDENLLNSLCSVGKSPGWNYLVAYNYSNPPRTGLNYSLLTPTTDRIPALLCKAALSIDTNTNRSNNFLKFRIFAWLMTKMEAEDRKIDRLAESIMINKICRSLDDLFVYSFSSSTINSEMQRGNVPIDRTLSNKESFLQGFYDVFFRSTPSVGYSGNIFGIIYNNLRLIRDDAKIFTDPTSYEGRTIYSGIKKEQYLFACFDLMLRIVAAQTPESILCLYSIDLGNNRSRFGMLVNQPSLDILRSYFSDSEYSQIGSNPPITYLRKVSVIHRKSIQNRAKRQSYFMSIKDFLANIKNSSRRSLDVFQSSEFKNYVGLFDSIFSKEVANTFVKSDTAKVKKSLFKLSLHENQTKLSKYMHGELKERTTNKDIIRSIISNPKMNAFPKSNYDDFLPLDPISLISFDAFSKYFSGQEYQPVKGNNKKIFSVGIPNNLNKNIQGNSRINNFNSGRFVKIKFWKIDRLRPDVLFTPKSYAFDMNRFSTRNPSNWNFNSTNLGDIPTKIYDPLTKTFSVSRSLNEALNEILFNYEGAFSSVFDSYLGLSQEEYTSLIRETYINQVNSFLCEEYINWYTDTSVNETHLYHYNKPQMSYASKNSYARLIDAMRSNSSTSTNLNSAIFFDPSSSGVISIPVSSLSSNPNIPTNNTLRTTINLTDTAVTYLNSQTLMSDVEMFKKSIVYPKKFDRVFNVLLDPDDFFVDQTVLSTSLKNQLLTSGYLVSSGGSLKTRDMSSDDAALFEYFVTVEPFNYENQI